MSDHRELIEKHLGKLGLGPHREEEILRELSEHLADHADALETRGMASQQAMDEALEAESNWPELRNEILSAETEETTMNYRTKVLWIPALCALTLSNVLLALMQIFGRPPHFYVFHTGKGMELFCAFIVPWLISQPVVGAVAAYWSRRAGGAIRHQLLAALSPAIALLGVFVLVLPFASIILHEGVRRHIQPSAFVLLTVTWVLLPSLPLLLGAAPFLRKPQPQS
jgi:hypothetical protein